MRGRAFRHAQQRPGNLRRTSGFTERLHEKLRAIVRLGAPRASAQLELHVQHTILQLSCGDTVLISKDFVGSRHLRKRQRR
ncbi:MAG TPA: hypothetical protein VJX69_00060 [Terriglobales bacterium]|nr:hypothetical protein [Terriglobales bacterium]